VSHEQTSEHGRGVTDRAGGGGVSNEASEQKPEHREWTKRTHDKRGVPGTSIHRTIQDPPGDDGSLASAETARVAIRLGELTGLHRTMVGGGGEWSGEWSGEWRGEWGKSIRMELLAANHRRSFRGAEVPFQRTEEKIEPPPPEHDTSSTSAAFIRRCATTNDGTI
jgi:hypothetical protein